jgi:hypothetical protein
MKEISVRKYHRIAGIILAIFILLQVLSGVVLTVENILGIFWGGVIHDIHYRYGLVGNVYRIILGIGLVWLLVTGLFIAIKIQARTKKPQQSKTTKQL